MSQIKDGKGLWSENCILNNTMKIYPFIKLDKHANVVHGATGKHT